MAFTSPGAMVSRARLTSGVGEARRAVRVVAEAFLFGLLPAVLVAAATLGTIGNHYGFDFRAYWEGGQDVLAGLSPYPTVQTVLTHEQGYLQQFVYPAPAALMMAAFALLPFPVAAGIFTLLSIVALAGALRVLGVSDWRCYGALFACGAVVGALRLGSVEPFLVLGTAVLWQYRDRRAAAVSALVALVCVKVFLWPLAIWMVATRRIRTAMYAIAAGAVVSAGAWWLVGLNQLRRYPQLLRALSRVEYTESYSLAAFAHSLGFGAAASMSVAAVLGAGALGAVAIVARRSPQGELCAFALALAASLLLTPIVWLQYFALIFVPLAVVSKRMGLLWLMPLLAWPPGQSAGSTLRIGFQILLWTVVLATVARSPRDVPAVG